MNTPVNFELAKLLKEKGFDNRTAMVWSFSLGKPHLIKTHLSLELNDSEYNAPIIADVVMWLYEKHGLWVHAMKSFNDFTPYIQCDWNYRKDSITGVLEFMQKRFNSPTETYEAALEYCITKIIP